MPFDIEVISYVYEKNNGYCIYCEKRLSFVNYGKRGERGSWHIDHSKPKAKGGTDHGNNLVPACIDCNQDKSDKNGSYYKTKFEYETIGGQLADALGLPKGFLGSSRKKVPK